MLQFLLGREKWQHWAVALCVCVYMQEVQTMRAQWVLSLLQPFLLPSSQQVYGWEKSNTLVQPNYRSLQQDLLLKTFVFKILKTQFGFFFP